MDGYNFSSADGKADGCFACPDDSSIKEKRAVLWVCLSAGKGKLAPR